MPEPYNSKKTYTASECAFCANYLGLTNCCIYPERIPQTILSKSFPGYPGYNENYCDKRSAVKAKHTQDSKRK